LKILQIVNKSPVPETDGGAIAVMNIAKGLILQKVSVDILFMDTPKHPFDKKLSANYFGILFFPVKTPAKISVFKVLANLLFSKIPISARRFISKTFEKAIINQIKNNSYDIIQLEGLYMLPYMAVIKQHSKASIAYRVHNIESKIWERHANQQKNFLKRWYFKNLVRRLDNFEKQYINSWDTLIPITKNELDYYNAAGNNKPSQIMPSGYFFTKRLPEVTPGHKLVYIGSLDWLPNIEGLTWFLRACWNTIYANNPHLEFHIAGRNPSEHFVHFVKNIKGVYYHGSVKSSENFIKSGSVFIVPLFAGSGMRIKIIEAISLGKPIITTTIGAEGLNLPLQNHINISNTVTDFVTNVPLLLNNFPLQTQLATNAYQFISKNFDNIVLANKLLGFYANHVKNE